MQYLFAYWPIAASIVAVYILQRTWVELSHRRRAKALGCKPAFKRPGWAPLGIDHVYRAISALIKYDYLTDEVAVYNEIGQRTTWRQTNMGAWFHMTCEPENIQAILATQFKDFELGPLRYGIFEPLLGRGIFTSDGKDWQHSRALLRPQFARSQISNLHVEEVHVQHLMNRLQRDNGGSNDGWTPEVDLAPLFFNLTLDSATEFLFGKSVNTQRLGATSTPNGTLEKPKNNGKGGGDDEEDWSSFGQRFDRANQAISYRFMLMDLYFLYNPKSFREDCAEVRRFADFYVQRALARSPAAAEEEDGSEYVFLNELVKETRDPYVLRSQLLNILIAGRDTTAGLLGWAFYELARHPDVYAQLHASVVSDFGPYSATDAASTDRITFETLKGNALLQHVLSETMRLHPSVPGNSRRAVRDTTLPRGGGDDGRSPLYIRAGEEVMYSVNMMHRRKDIWGPDALEFRPSRWEGRKVGWEFLPFNGGPRICLGQQFALTEAGYVMVRLLQRFDRIENLDPEKGEKTFLNVTSSPVKTLVKLHEA